MMPKKKTLLSFDTLLNDGTFSKNAALFSKNMSPKQVLAFAAYARKLVKRVYKLYPDDVEILSEAIEWFELEIARDRARGFMDLHEIVQDLRIQTCKLASIISEKQFYMEDLERGGGAAAFLLHNQQHENASLYFCLCVVSHWIHLFCRPYA